MSALLDRLRQYAAANPTDCLTVAMTVRENAELEAYRELGMLALKWRRRNDAERRRRMVRLAVPLQHEEPFQLTRRAARLRPCSPRSTWYSPACMQSPSAG